MKIISLAIALFILPFAAWAACPSGKCYVDFSIANESASDGSAAHPYKYIKGHTEAGITPVMPSPAARDKVILATGIKYRGYVKVTNGGTLRVTRSAGSITACAGSGTCTLSDAGADFSAVAAGDILYIYNDAAATNGTWKESIGSFTVSSVSGQNVIVTNLSTSAKAAYAGGDMTYKIWSPIHYTTEAGFGSAGDATWTGILAADLATCTDPPCTNVESATKYAPNSSNIMMHLQANYIRVSGLKFQDMVYPATWDDKDHPCEVSSGCDTGTGVGCNDWPANLVTSIYNRNGSSIYSANTLTGILIDHNTFDRTWRNTYISGSGSLYSYLENTLTNLAAYGLENAGSSSLIENNSLTGGGGINGVGNYSIVRGNHITNATLVSCLGHCNFVRASGTNYSWFIGNFGDNSVEGFYITYSAANSYVNIINNVLAGHIRYPVVEGQEGDYAIFASRCTNCNASNNTIVAVPGARGWSYPLAFGVNVYGQASPNGTARNNLVYLPESAGQRVAFGCTDETTCASFTSQNNIIYAPNSAGVAPFAYGGLAPANFKTLEAWQVLGFSTDSSGLPTFTDITGSALADFDLSLSASSAVGTTGGINLSSIYNYDILGQTRSNWSIGAYEYTGTTPSATIYAPFFK